MVQTCVLLGNSGPGGFFSWEQKSLQNVFAKRRMCLCANPNLPSPSCYLRLNHATRETSVSPQPIVPLGLGEARFPTPPHTPLPRFCAAHTNVHEPAHSATNRTASSVPTSVP